MKKKDFQQIVDDFVPSQERLVTTQEVVQHFKDKGRPFALRTLVKYATMGLIYKPLHIGNKGFYERDYIFDQLESIYILKSVVQCSLEEIKKLADHDSASLAEIVENLHILSSLMQKEIGETKGAATIASFLANTPKARNKVDQYLKVVSEGRDPVLAREDAAGEFAQALKG